MYAYTVVTIIVAMAILKKAQRRENQPSNVNSASNINTASHLNTK